MKGKIALEEHLSTPQNNLLWDSADEAGRNGKAYMDHCESRLIETSKPALMPALLCAVEDGIIDTTLGLPYILRLTCR